MESSTFRFVAVSIAVVLFFSCATLDEELNDTNDIPDLAADSIEHDPDVTTAAPELSDTVRELSPAQDAPVDVAAVPDDALPRLTPSVAEPPVLTESFPVPEPPIAEPEIEPASDRDRVAEEPAFPEPPAPEIASTPVPPSEPDADTAVPPAPSPSPKAAEVPRPEPPRPEPPPRSPEPRTERSPAAQAPVVPEPEPPVAAAPSVPMRVADEPAEEAVAEPPQPPVAAASDRREIETGVMTELNVVFRGFGWVYAGAESAGSGRVEFLRSERTDDSTVFVFRMTESGQYSLSFQRQDLTRGEFVDETVAVTAREDQPLVATPDDSPATDRPAAGAAETDETMAPAVPSDSPDSTPGLVSPIPDIDPRVVFENALVEGDAERAVAAVREFPIESVDGVDAARLARLLDRNGDVGGAIEFYELAASREPFGTDMAEILFALGALYERDSDRRSIRRSHGYYQRLVAEYPFSRLRDDARKRAAYLERYFLTIR